MRWVMVGNAPSRRFRNLVELNSVPLTITTEAMLLSGYRRISLWKPPPPPSFEKVGHAFALPTCHRRCHRDRLARKVFSLRLQQLFSPYAHQH
jgi:hypothetical protein